MNLTLFLSHEDDEATAEIIRVLSGQVESDRIQMFANVIVDSGTLPGLHLVECDWWRFGTQVERRSVSSLLADVGRLKNLRIVALATSIGRRIAEHLDGAHETLWRECEDASGMSTTISTARIAVVGRREELPHELFFSPMAHHNLAVLPYDRFDDAMHADSISSSESARFAAHGAVDVAALCGLWVPMLRAPIDRSTNGDDGLQIPSGRQSADIRLVQSRLRSLNAPTFSLQEMFGVQHDAIPVPHRFVQEMNLTQAQIDALAEALIADVQGFRFPSYAEDPSVIDKGSLLAVLKDVARGAIKEAPSAFCSMIRGEIDTIIELALQEIVDPDGQTLVVSGNQGNVNYSFELGVDPWEQARIKDELTTISPAVWSGLVDRILALVGGDASANAIRAKVLGGPDRVPCSKRDLLAGLEGLPGALPRFALGDGSLTLLGMARNAAVMSPKRFTARFGSADLLGALVENWDRLLDIVADHDPRLSSALAQTDPLDWSGNVLTVVFGSEMDAKSKRTLERVGADAPLKEALREITGAEPALIQWIGSEDEFRAMVVPMDADVDAEDPSTPEGAPKSRSGLLVRIGERILEEREAAETYLEDVASRIERIGTGVFVHRVQPAIYALIALGFAGRFFGFLTSPLGQRLLQVVPDTAGNGVLYGPIVVAALVASGALTNFGKSIGNQLRFVLAFAGWVIGSVVVFGLPWDRSALIAAHVAIAVLLVIAWGQASEAKSKLRRRLVRAGGVVYAFFIVIVLALISNRGGGPLGLIADPQTLLRIGVLIDWTSWALMAGGFLVLIVSRGRARVQLEREVRSFQWLTSEADRADEAYQALGLAYVQWNVTACSLAQVIREPYGPLVASAAQQENPRLEGIRRAGFADLKLTNRGSDLLRAELRQALVPSGWLKERYDVRVEAFFRLEAERSRVGMTEVREVRPEADALVPTSDELSLSAPIRSKRLLFAELGARGVFDEVCSAPIADEGLLELLAPVFRDPDAQRIEGASVGLSTAFEFLVQAGPSASAPSVPSDEVRNWQGNLEVSGEMQQLLWWPKFLPQSHTSSSSLVEETAMRWNGGGPASGSTSVQLLAVRVDFSPLYNYSTLRFARDEPDEDSVESAAEERDVVRPPSGRRIYG